MPEDVVKYIESLEGEFRLIAEKLFSEIESNLPGVENKVWHGHPVWFLAGNPAVGFSLQKAGVRLMFWSGVEFNEAKLKPGTGKFKDASIFYNKLDEIDSSDLRRWLKKSRNIQWDYKNIIKNKGLLKKL